MMSTSILTPINGDEQSNAFSTASYNTFQDEDVHQQFHSIDQHELNRNNRWPYVCTTFVILQIILFVAMIGYNKGFESPSTNPLIGASEETISLFGGKDCEKIRDGQYWRLVVAIFLHVGVVHLVMNMLIHYQFATDVEREWGHKTWIGVYLLTGFYGNLSSCLFDATDDYITAGASGALFGLMGATIVDLLINWESLENPWRPFLVQCGTAFANLLIGLLPGIDNWAHIGGLLSGAALGCLFLKFFPPYHLPNLDTKPVERRLKAIGSVSSLFLFVSGLVLFFEDVVFDCEFCDVVS